MAGKGERIRGSSPYNRRFMSKARRMRALAHKAPVMQARVNGSGYDSRIVAKCVFETSYLEKKNIISVRNVTRYVRQTFNMIGFEN